MSYEIPLFYVGIFPANQDMSVEATFQFVGVRVRANTGTGVVGAGVGGAALDLPASAGDPILGILQNNPQINEAGTVLCEGISKALISGTVHIGNILAVDTAGNLKAATSGQFGVAMALEENVTGDLGTVYVRNFGKQ